jgi:uncharacterized protein YndB with AHSA1/START domain
MIMITITTQVRTSAAQVWKCFTDAVHIKAWNFADPSWHCPAAVNDLNVGGSFCYTMAARDGSMSFDFKGTYTLVDPEKRIEYDIEDGRKVIISFEATPEHVIITESFEPENMNPVELQQQGWQQILNNFAQYAEASADS